LDANFWLEKPSDTWYDSVEDGATIDIKVEFIQSKKYWLVFFEGVPKKGKSKLRVDVGTLPAHHATGGAADDFIERRTPMTMRDTAAYDSSDRHRGDPTLKLADTTRT